METLTRLVSQSLARHGFDRPPDYRRLQWSRWFRCESHHSLLSVPSKPGVFALAEEVVDFGLGTAQVGAAAPGCPAGQSPADMGSVPTVDERRQVEVEEQFFRAASLTRSPKPEARSRVPEADSRCMLAVGQFFEDGDIAFALDRMFSYQNPMRAGLASGRYFVRYVVIEDASQRRSICAALNQWIACPGEKGTGIGAHFATSLELPEHNLTAKHLSTDEATHAHAETSSPVEMSAPLETAASAVPRPRSGAASSTQPDRVPSHTTTAPRFDSGAAANIHCPSPFPSGF